jgi:hypothetical protein
MCHKAYDDIYNSDVPNVLKRLGHFVGFCAVTLNFRSLLQECTAYRGDHLRDVILKNLKTNIKGVFIADTQ